MTYSHATIFIFKVELDRRNSFFNNTKNLWGIEKNKDQFWVAVTELHIDCMLKSLPNIINCFQNMILEKKNLL